MFDMHIKCCYDLNVPAPPTYIIDDEDFSFLEGSKASRMPLYISMVLKEVIKVDTNYTYQQCDGIIPTIPSK